MNNPPSWHLDKKVPIALIVSIVLQTSVLIWWGAGINFQVIQNKKDINEIEMKAQTNDEKFLLIMEKLARLEALIVNRKP